MLYTQSRPIWQMSRTLRIISLSLFYHKILFYHNVNYRRFVVMYARKRITLPDHVLVNGYRRIYDTLPPTQIQR